MPLPPLARTPMSETSHTFILYSQWVATVASDGFSATSNEVIPDGAVVIEDGRIAAVGTASEIRATYRSRHLTEVELPPYHLLIPGLINCHNHLAMSMLRGFADDLSLLTWLNDYVWPTEKAIMCEEYVYQGSLLACYEALMSGTTMVNDSYFLPEAAIRATCEAGLRAVHGAAVLDIGDHGMPKQFEKALAFINQIHAAASKESPTTDLVRVSYAPHSAYTVASEWLAQGAAHLAALNKAYPNTPVIFHTHLHETKAERAAFENAHGGKTALQVMDEAGAVNEFMVAAHCVHMTPDEIALMAERRANVCHCPKSNLKLASGFCPVDTLLKAGVNVCLGTDGGCSNNSVDMLSEMQYAALLAKAVSGDPTAVDAYTALRMATRNGSRALGRLHDLGSIEVGKLADLVAVDLAGKDQTGLPIYDPISHLVYTTHPRVTNVWVGGRRLVKDGHVQTITINPSRQEQLVRKLKDLRLKLSADATTDRENVVPL